MGILIKNGTVVTDAERWIGDVRCRDGLIAELGEGLESVNGEKVLDASGQFVFPGGVDPHVHMELAVMGTRSSDDFESGTAAGIAGGTTTIVDFIHPERGQGLLDAIAERKEEAAKAVADYGLHMAVTWWGDSTARWIEQCVREEGIPSFKVYTAYKDSVGLDDVDLVRVLQTIADLDALVLAHCEHAEIIEDLRDRLVAEGHTEPRYHAVSRPAAAEGEATGRMAMLAATTGASLYVVHVTCQDSVAALRRAQSHCDWVHGETCIQYLLLDDQVYEQEPSESAAFVCAPPIRPARHQEDLWKALQDGVLEVVSTDHCPFTRAQREAGRDDFRKIPGGTAGIEHRLALLYTHGVAGQRLDLHRFVDLVSTRPAKRFGLYPRKGAISVGSDADLVLWDPEATATISAETHHHRVDRSNYEGFEVRGLPSTVIANGVVRYRDGDLRVERGTGRFLKRHL